VTVKIADYKTVDNDLLRAVQQSGLNLAKKFGGNEIINEILNKEISEGRINEILIKEINEGRINEILDKVKDELSPIDIVYELQQTTIQTRRYLEELKETKHSVDFQINMGPKVNQDLRVNQNLSIPPGYSLSKIISLPPSDNKTNHIKTFSLFP